MTNGIIGAKGDMAKNLLLPLLSKLGPIAAVDQDSPKDDWAKVWQADAIWLAIPRDNIPQLLRGKKLSGTQLVIDICSIKRRLSAVIEPTGAAHFSLHPLHGPHVPLQGQKWAIIKTYGEPNNNPIKYKIFQFLKDQGISFLEPVTEDEHDFMLGVTLSLPELLTLFMDELIKNYADGCKQPQPTMERLTEWAVPASNALFGFYIHSINSSADWLRKDLICQAHGDLLDSAKNALHNISQVLDNQIEPKLKNQRDFINALPLEERKRARQWIERWFVDSTQKIFSFHKNIPLKPKLTIQEKADDIELIFPNKREKIKVGIHGIEGCFTHESIMRFCEELGVDINRLELHYLVEAEKVIKAAVDGTVDRGVFAMANSGSGAYVSSMHAMAQYQFDVLAVYGMEIMQCLMAHPSINSVSQVKEVFGHPQAVSQCQRTFAEKYPEIILTPGQDQDDTALCAERIAAGEFPPSTATLASQLAAKLYGLNILEYGMHHDPFNTTTFLIIKKKS